MTVNIRIEGAGAAANKFFQAANKVQHLQDAIWRSILIVEGDMKRYPPPPTGSGYIRTGRLGSSWQSRIFASNAGMTESRVQYSPFVVSEAKQAWMHRGRWPTDVEVVENRKDDIAREFLSVVRGLF